jgi:ElaB/YqjD/DUF883 family membrane-anchored ribosome-binding protein
MEDRMAASDMDNAIERHGRNGAARGFSPRKARAQMDKAMEEASDTVVLAVGRAADRAKAATAAAANRARAAYDQAAGAAQSMAATVDPMVRERPYLTVGLALAAGLLCGLLIGGHGPRVIYVKPRD